MTNALCALRGLPDVDDGERWMGVVVAVSRSDVHGFSKSNVESIELITGQGVAGDTHLGVTVQHRSRVRRDPTQPNLRQVHLLHAELLDELTAAGFILSPGVVGENVTTRGLDLLAMPTGTRLQFDGGAVVELTGLRNPCSQLDDFQQGLMAAMLGRDEHGRLIRKAGVMAIVVAGGSLAPGAAVQALLPPAPHRPLERV